MNFFTNWYTRDRRGQRAPRLVPRCSWKYDDSLLKTKQTEHMDYWNHVLWSDETKINLFGSVGVKHVWQQPGEYKDKSVLPTVKHAGGSVMV